MIAILAAVIAVIAVSYYAIMINKLSKETYKNIASDIAESTAQVIDLDDVKTLKSKVDPIVQASETKPLAEESTDDQIDAYLVQFNSLQSDAEFTTAFENTKKFLKDFGATNSEFVSCLYIQYVDFTNKCVVYLCDTDESETSCPPGLLDPVHDEVKGVLDNPNLGFVPHILKTERYGWLITAGAPIKDGDSVVAYAMVDIDMNMIRQRQSNSIIRLTAYMLVTLLLIGAIDVVWVNLWFIRPLKKLTKATDEYDSANPNKTHTTFQKLEVNTYDELGDLAESLRLMENDVYVRFNELIETNEKLVTSKEETKKMQILANQDGLTGVKNKISYNSEVSRLNEQIKNGELTHFAVVMVDLNYLKDVNDSYGHDTGDVALIKLAGLVCETFKFSPVYRIGGDEFVVISRGKDYQKISILVDDLKKKISKTNKDSDILDGEHISAAVGYSLFDSLKDKTVDDVFRRADKEMYINKREQKNK